jgi:hypothetical protein
MKDSFITNGLIIGSIIGGIGDIPLNRLDDFYRRGNTKKYYNAPLQMLHMLLVMKRDGVPKPKRVYCNFKYTVYSF